MSKQTQRSEAAKAYRGDYAYVTTGDKRNVTITISAEEFLRLDAHARGMNISRSALATRYVLSALRAVYDEGN
jgi:hypothetical protein